MKSLILLLPLLLFVACSKSTTSTKLKVSSNFIFGGSTLNGTFTAGGLMVWGQGPGGEAFGRAMVGTDTINVQLTNGAWTFYAMSWELVTANFTGKPRCAKSTASLSGAALAVNLNLTNANCTDPVFGNGIHGTTPDISMPPAKVEWCSTSPSAVTAHTDKCTDDTTDVNRKAAKGHGTSYRYRMRSFDRKGSSTTFLSDEIASYCLNGNSSPATPLHSGVTSEMPGLPVGVGNTTPFHISLDVYLQTTDCENATSPGDKKGFMTVELPHGLQSQQPRLKYVVEPSGAGRSKIYVQMSEADMCNGRTVGSASFPYAGGQGTAERPYLICSGAQFLKLPVTSAIMHYKLLADINLNPFSKGLTTEGTEIYFSCLEPGGNFLPIGKNTGDCGVSAATDFTGSFDGNGHSVTGMRIQLEDIDNVGMFGSMTGSNGVRNIRLLKSEISGRSNVGALVGFSTSSGLFSNIEVRGADIEARDDGSNTYGNIAGGVFGRVFNATLSNISTRLSSIRADRTDAGGIAGVMDSVNANYLFASGMIEGNEDRVGGIVGDSLSVTLNNSRFSGYISGDYRLGGIIGNATSTTVSNTYAHAGLHSTLPSSTVGFHVGGLFGIFNGTTGTHTVTNAYYAGRIIVDCGAANSTCGIGQIVGTTGGTTAAADFSNVSYVEQGYASTTLTNFGNPITSAQAYNGSTLAGLGSDFSLSAGDLPRLSVEAPTHPCRLNNASATVTAQIIMGRGSSSTNPILLCNPTQLAAMQANPTRHYRLEGLVDGLDIATTWPITFSGSLNGNGLGIIGMKVEGGAGAGIAWMNNLSGSIYNLGLFGSKVSTAFGSPGTGTAALIATTLSGTIDNVDFYGLKWKTDKSGGAIANNITASGRLLNSEIEIDMVAAGGYVGGISQTNYGKIEGMEIYGSIRSQAAGFLYAVGGVVSENYGKIYRSEIGIELLDDQSTTGNYNALVTQINRTGGIIEDVILDEARYFGSSMAAYGIAYANQGLIRRVYSNAEIQLSSGNPRPVYVVTGNNSGTLNSIVYSQYAELPDALSSDSFGTSGSCDLLFTTYAAAGSWLTAFATPTDFIMTVDNQQFRVTAHTAGATDTITVASPCGALGASTGILSYSPAELSGTYVNELLLGYANFSSWDGSTDSDERSIWVADMSDPAQEARVMAIMGAYISGQPLPETPPVWEFNSGDGIRLFTFD